MYEEQRTVFGFRFSMATAMGGLTVASLVFGALYGSLLLVGLAFMESCLAMLVLAAVLQAVHEFRTGKPSQLDVGICIGLALLAGSMGIILGAIGAAQL